MDTILQVDSRLEETYKSDKGDEVLIGLYHENCALHTQLKELNSKLDLALNSITKTRSESALREKAVSKHKDKRKSLEKLISSSSKGKAFIDTLEKKALELEENNKKLRKSIEYNYSLSVASQLKPDFERFQHYLKQIFKLTSINAKANKEITENKQRIYELMEEINESRTKTTFLESKSNQNMHQTDKLDNICILFRNHKNQLKQELSDLLVSVEKKKSELAVLSAQQKKFEDEINSLNTSKSERELRKIRSLSPLLTTRQSNYKDSANPESVYQRSRPRYHSIKLAKISEGTENIRRYSGRFEIKLETPQSIEKLDLKHQENLPVFGAAKIFENVRLSPNELELAYNFSSAALNRNFVDYKNK